MFFLKAIKLFCFKAVPKGFRVFLSVPEKPAVPDIAATGWADYLGKVVGKSEDEDCVDEAISSYDRGVPLLEFIAGHKKENIEF